MGVHVFTTMADDDGEQIAENEDTETNKETEHEAVEEEVEEEVKDEEEAAEKEGNEEENVEEGNEAEENVEGGNEEYEEFEEEEEHDEGEIVEDCDCLPLRRPVCGNNGVTYLNKCKYKCAADRNPKLRLKFLGSCNENQYIINSHHYHLRRLFK